MSRIEELEALLAAEKKAARQARTAKATADRRAFLASRIEKDSAELLDLEARSGVVRD